jgi:transcriptional regulator with XRE-family HTH domain
MIELYNGQAIKSRGVSTHHSKLGYTGTGILRRMASEKYSRHLIRMARRQAGLTQQALAERAGTSQAAMSAYESGRRSPSVDTLCRILGAAGFEVRMRLTAPDTHGSSLAAAEALLPNEQVEQQRERERARVARHRVNA